MPVIMIFHLASGVSDVYVGQELIDVLSLSRPISVHGGLASSATPKVPVGINIMVTSYPLPMADVCHVL
jgi:hypothetical protein